MKKSKILLALFMAIFAVLLSSCMFPGPGHTNNGGQKEHNHHDNGHGQGKGHDKK